MSSPATNAVATHFLQFSLQYSSLALLWYDYALTLPREVQYIWNERFRLSTAVYIGCRYALVANVLYLLAITDKLGSTKLASLHHFYTGATSGTKSSVPSAYSDAPQWTASLFFFPKSCQTEAVVETVVFALRTVALYGRNNWVTAYMGVLALADIALGITHVPGLRCVGSSSLPMCVTLVLISEHFLRKFGLDCLVVPNEMLAIVTVIFETSSSFLTIIRCVIAFRTGGGVKSLRQGVTFILFEQGSQQPDSTISIFTVAGVILNYVTPPGFFRRLLDAFTLPLSGILTARFILQLREWYAIQLCPSKTDPTHTSIVFREAHSGVGLLSIVAMDDFGEDPVLRANANRTAQLENQLTQQVLREGSLEEPDDGVQADSPAGIHV
ncbi:hypothetical protein C8J57DRAFT_1628796 [Mycena rebaudengoi]|nr:hypothetical protein C8J57DRAFT_1628796 [Mycena rebaudengoi]